MPDGRYARSVISPTGSGSAAISLEARRPSRRSIVGVERQAVDERGVVAGGARGGDVLRVGGERASRSSRRIAAAIARERGVLRRRVGARELARGGARGLADAAACRRATSAKVPRPGTLRFVIATIVARCSDAGVATADADQRSRA